MTCLHGRIACAIALLTCAAYVHAKPIAFAHGTTVMAEHGASTMNEVQGFYAPSYRARQYTGEIYEGTELAALVRVFKRNAWLEAGLNEDGKVQAMLMFNF